MVRRPRVPDDVVVAEDGIDVPGRVDRDVRELVAVADGRIGVDVDGPIGERCAPVGRQRDIDAVVVARAGDNAELGRASGLRRCRDRAVDLVDRVAGRVDRQVADGVLARLECVQRVDRRAELEPRAAGIGRTTDRDALRGVVVAQADLRCPVRGHPLAVVDGLGRRQGMERPGRAAVRARGDVDVGEGQARDVDVVGP